MKRLENLTDHELLQRIVHAERMDEKWGKRCISFFPRRQQRAVLRDFAACLGAYALVRTKKPDDPGFQEAYHTWLFWHNETFCLYTEEDQRGGEDALYGRLAECGEGNTDE